MTSTAMVIQVCECVHVDTQAVQKEAQDLHPVRKARFAGLTAHQGVEELCHVHALVIVKIILLLVFDERKSLACERGSKQRHSRGNSAGVGRPCWKGAEAPVQRLSVMQAVVRHVM